MTLHQVKRDKHQFDNKLQPTKSLKIFLLKVNRKIFKYFWCMGDACFYFLVYRRPEQTFSDCLGPFGICLSMEFRPLIPTVFSLSLSFLRVAPLIGRWCAANPLPEVERESCSTPWEKHGPKLILQNGRLKDSLIDTFATCFRLVLGIVVGIWNKVLVIAGDKSSEKCICLLKLFVKSPLKFSDRVLKSLFDENE